MKYIYAKKYKSKESLPVLISDEDFEFLSKLKWRITMNGYVVSGISGKIIMHRLILNVSDSSVYIDHINGNPLDNRRENLRKATNSQNQANRKKLSTNSSGARGVTFNKKAKKWQAQIKVNNKNIYLGLFSSISDAAKAYTNSAFLIFGEYANPMFINKEQ